MSNETHCETFDEQLHELIDGRLPAPLATAMRAHARSCLKCAAAVRQEDRMVRLCSGLGPNNAPIGLADRVHESVRSLAVLESRIDVPAAPSPVRAAQWMNMAAAITIALTVGGLLGVWSERRQVTDDAQPVKAPVATTPTHDDTAEHRFRTIGEPVREQLARHIDSTEGLYAQAMSLDEPTLARPLLRAELKMSGLQRSTPALRATMASMQDAPGPTAMYLTKAAGMLRALETWVASEESLVTVRQKLRTIQFGDEIGVLRKAIGVQTSGVGPGPFTEMGLPTELGERTAITVYLRSRQNYYAGRRVQALMELQALQQEYPSHVLGPNIRLWIARLSREVSDESIKIETYRHGTTSLTLRNTGGRLFVHTASRGRAGIVLVDNARLEMQSPKRSVEAFYALWRAAQQRQQALWDESPDPSGPRGNRLYLIANIRRSTEMVNRRRAHVREITLEFDRRIWEDTRTRELLDALRETCGQSALTSDTRGPREIVIAAPSSACPKNLYPK